MGGVKQALFVGFFVALVVAGAAGIVEGDYAAGDVGAVGRGLRVDEHGPAVALDEVLAVAACGGAVGRGDVYQQQAAGCQRGADALEEGEQIVVRTMLGKGVVDDLPRGGHADAGGNLRVVDGCLHERALRHAAAGDVEHGGG